MHTVDIREGDKDAPKEDGRVKGNKERIGCPVMAEARRSCRSRKERRRCKVK